MKKFFTNVLSTIVGVLLSSVILGVIAVFIFMGIVGVLINTTTSTYTSKENSILNINLNGVMKDRVADNPILDFISYDQANELSLKDILLAIKKAKFDNNISGIYINSGYFSAGSASLVEIREQLKDFKKSGKFIITYADDYLQGGYFLSSVADKIIINPQGSLDLHGLSVNRTFYKGLLDKIGVQVQVFKVGTYKSAVEPYILDQMSEANKEQTSAYANSIWSTILNEISIDRNISIDRLNQIADSLPVFRESSYIVKNNLVDTIMYEQDVKKYLKSLVGISETEKLNLASVSDIVSIEDAKNNKEKNEIAILYAEGSIVSGSASDDINDKYLIKQITNLQDDDKVKAVVFRVNSPGGSAYASEQIWKAITNLKSKKPVVVSMGDYAASGGYYISCNANKIFAEPTTLTGSIGIFGMFPNIEGLTNKIGLKFDDVKTNKMSDFGDITRPMSEGEKMIVQKYIERGYDIFLTRCSEGRNIPKDSLNLIAQGRVWTGEQAISIGLVDKLGGVDDAIKEAAILANIKSYYLGEYPELVSPLEALFKTGKEDLASLAIKEYLGDDFQVLKTLKEIKELKEQDFIQARMPYDLQIK